MAKKLFHEVVIEKMDGRTNRWLHEKTNIAESEISRILNGKLIPSETQVKKINAALGIEPVMD